MYISVRLAQNIYAYFKKLNKILEYLLCEYILLINLEFWFVYMLCWQAAAEMVNIMKKDQ